MKFFTPCLHHTGEFDVDASYNSFNKLDAYKKQLNVVNFNVPAKKSKIMTCFRILDHPY